MSEEIIIEKQKPQITKIILAVLISAIVFGLIGYVYGKKNNSVTPSAPTAETAVIEQSVAATTSPTASMTADETANWKTYTNDTYGFSFKYPADWETITSVKGEIGFNPIGEKYYIEESEMSVIRFVEGNGAAFSETNYSSGYEPTTIAGRTAYRRTLMGEISITFEANNQAVSIVNSTTPAVTGSSNSSKASQYNQIFEHILSTFQFTK